MKRYPFLPLEELIVFGAGPRVHEHIDIRVSAARLVADTLGRSQQQVYRWRNVGVSFDQADELATRAGFHPASVWPEWMDDQLNEFETKRRARNAAKMRRYRKRSPRARQKNREYMAQYRRDYPEAKRAYDKRYRELNAERLREKARQYKAARREETRAKARAYYQKNRERICAQERERYYQRKAEAEQAAVSPQPLRQAA